MNSGGLVDLESSKRNSDVSTVDAEISSEGECQDSYPFSVLLESASKLHLFESISDEQKYMYCILRESLREVYKSLEQELEPVCITDSRGIIPKSVDLTSVANSMITRRRTSTLIQ